MISFKTLSNVAVTMKTAATTGPVSSGDALGLKWGLWAPVTFLPSGFSEKEKIYIKFA